MRIQKLPVQRPLNLVVEGNVEKGLRLPLWDGLLKVHTTLASCTWTG